MATDHVRIRKVGVIMNGVTGRMGRNQHLLRSLIPILEDGGIYTREDETIIPDPILVGRHAGRLTDLAAETGICRWTTDLDSALSDAANQVYFDSQTTELRADAVRRAIAAGKHVYCEKPTAASSEEAYGLYLAAQEAGVKHGVVQDKLWLPGFRKLRALIETGFFGRILSVRGEFGYFVFEGDHIEPQRPSWNYRVEDGGGIILDMFPHWAYLLDTLFGRVTIVSCVGARHIDRRWDEEGLPYQATADDAAYATFEIDGGVVAQMNSSWATRVRRDDVFTLQVDGTRGSAVATLRECWAQGYAATPRITWDPDGDAPTDLHAGWTPVPDYERYGNAFRAQWELFLRHVVIGEPFAWSLLEGAKGVQLAECALESWRSRARVDVPVLPPVD